MWWQTRNFNRLEKTKKNSTVLPWRHHGDTNTDFQLKPANFLVPKSRFMFKWQITWNVEYGGTWRSKKSTCENHTGAASLYSSCANHWDIKVNNLLSEKKNYRNVNTITEKKIKVTTKTWTTPKCSKEKELFV